MPQDEEARPNEALRMGLLGNQHTPVPGELILGNEADYHQMESKPAATSKCPKIAMIAICLLAVITIGAIVALIIVAVDDDDSSSSPTPSPAGTTQYFTANLSDSLTSTTTGYWSSATATAYITLFSDNTLQTKIGWDMTAAEGIGSSFTYKGHSYLNQIIGLHIHAGDSQVANGPILYGLCGGGASLPTGGPANLSLPSFGAEGCQSSTTSSGSVSYTGAPCSLTAPNSPCFQKGAASASSLASYLRSTDPSQLYINFHTTKSFAAHDLKPLGLIRGQLSEPLGATKSVELITRNSNVYYRSLLVSDATAVPASANSRSQAEAYLTLFPDNSVALSLTVNLQGTDQVSALNPIIGVHLHTGNSSQNGPILLGFCGGPILPGFGTPNWEQQCRQSSAGHAVYIATPCALQSTHPGVCTPQSTLAEAALAITSATASQSALPLYMNIHTNSSLIANKGTPLGFIRGQLQPGSSIPYPQAITSQRQSSTLFFRATLGPSTFAPSTTSIGQAVLALYPDNTWKLKVSVELALSDALVGDEVFPGIHIHVGGSTTNGLILVGFCGSNPLPYFGTPLSACARQIGPITPTTKSYTFTQVYTTGSACVLTGSKSPCYKGGVGQDLNSVAEVVRMSGAAEVHPFYLNIHTPKFPLGLIRGQLVYQDVADWPL